MAKAMEEKLDLSQIKALSKEKRMEFAALIRKDPELWDAVNGLGGLSEMADYGVVQGTVTQLDEPARNVKVVASIEGRETFETVTNQYGYYKLSLDAGLYNVSFESDVKKAEGKEIEIFDGKTETLNFEFEKAKDEEVIRLLSEESTADPETIETTVEETTTSTTEPVVESTTETTTETTSETTSQ